MIDPGSSGSFRTATGTRTFRTTTAGAGTTDVVQAPRPLEAAPPLAAPVRRVRRARVALTRVDPWSVMKTALVFSTCLVVVLVVAVIVLYVVLDVMGVFRSVQHSLHTALNVHLPISPVGVIGGAVVLGIVNVILLTALATIGAFVYNLSADLMGGIEVVLTEQE